MTTVNSDSSDNNKSIAGRREAVNGFYCLLGIVRVRVEALDGDGARHGRGKDCALKTFPLLETKSFPVEMC